MSLMTLLYGPRDLPDLKLDLTALKLIGQGNERRCYIDPAAPAQERRLYKAAPLSRCRQTRREIAYFNFLKQRGVPFTHIPEYYGCGRVGTFLVQIQQFIAPAPGVQAYDLERALICPEIRHTLSPAKLQQAYADLKSYLLRCNVLPSDMLVHNLMLTINEDSGNYHLYLIDGLGSHTFIPLNNFIPALGERTVERQCAKFCASVANATAGALTLTP